MRDARRRNSSPATPHSTLQPTPLSPSAPQTRLFTSHRPVDSSLFTPRILRPVGYAGYASEDILLLITSGVHPPKTLSQFRTTGGTPPPGVGCCYFGRRVAWRGVARRGVAGRTAIRFPSPAFLEALLDPLLTFTGGVPFVLERVKSVRDNAAFH